MLIPAPITGRDEKRRADPRLAENHRPPGPCASARRSRTPPARSEPFASASSASARSARPSRASPPIAPRPPTPACGSRSSRRSSASRQVRATARSRARLTSRPCRVSARQLRRGDRSARCRRTGAHAGRAAARPRHVGGHGEQGAGRRARRASRIDRGGARRGISLRGHRARRGAVSRHARRSPACRVRRSRARDRQRHVEFPPDVARRARTRRSIRRWRGRRSLATRSPIRRAISTASMPPTSCCCSRRSLDGDACRGKRSTSAASAT